MPLFGGYSELENAPQEAYVRHLLHWEARREADAQQQQKTRIDQDVALWKASQQ